MPASKDAGIVFSLRARRTRRDGMRMDGEADGQDEARPQDPQEGQGAEAGREERQQTEPAGAHKAPRTVGAAEYQEQLRAKDAQIEELRAKVAEAAKTAEATETLNGEIAALRRQMADERVEFELRAAGARNVKAARAMLADYDGDVEALREANGWLFSQAGGTSQNSSQSAGDATGLEPAGVSGGSDAAYMRRWERIAGLSEGKGE
jgi:hypothetical protein